MSAHGTLRFALAAAVTAAAACAPTIISDRDETIPVPRGATWAWATRPAPDSSWGERDALAHNEILLQRFQRAIEAEMESRGFRKVDEASESEFLLSVHLGTIRSGRRGPTGSVAIGVGVGWGGWRHRPGWGWYPPYGWNWGWYGPPVWGGAAMVPYPNSMAGGEILVALLRQRSSGQVAWRGQYNADVYDSQQMSQHRVQKVVDKMFEGLR